MVKKISLSAMFFALGLILPFFTGQIPQIGSMLLPMHIPVFFMWVYLWLEIWWCDWIFIAIDALCFIWHATNLSNRNCNVI